MFISYITLMSRPSKTFTFSDITRYSIFSKVDIYIIIIHGVTSNICVLSLNTSVELLRYPAPMLKS